MKFKDMIAGLESSRGKPLTGREMLLLVKIWNLVIECVADEWPIVGEQILELKESAKEKHVKYWMC